MTRFSIQNYFSAHQELFSKIDSSSISTAINLIEKKFKEGRKVITCGNGGSASTASHFITDWNKMINIATGKKFRGVSLCDNVGLITAYGNDISYDQIFSGQLQAIMDEKDLLIVVSGSGNSVNIIKALEYANSIGACTLAILGYDGGGARKISKYSVLVPSFDMQLCEDIHLMFGHMVMKSLCNSAIKK